MTMTNITKIAFSSLLLVTHIAHAEYTDLTKTFCKSFLKQMFTSTEPLDPQSQETRTLCNDFLAKKAQEKNHALENLTEQTDVLAEQVEHLVECNEIGACHANSTWEAIEKTNQRINALEKLALENKKNILETQHEIALLKEQKIAQQPRHNSTSRCLKKPFCVAKKCVNISLCLSATFTNKE